MHIVSVILNSEWKIKMFRFNNVCKVPFCHFLSSFHCQSTSRRFNHVHSLDGFAIILVCLISRLFLWFRPFAFSMYWSVLSCIALFAYCLTIAYIWPLFCLLTFKKISFALTSTCLQCLTHGANGISPLRKAQCLHPTVSSCSELLLAWKYFRLNGSTCQKGNKTVDRLT